MSTGILKIWLLHELFVLVISADIEVVTPSSNGNSCKTCHDLVINFRNGIEKTSKSNFGGGNTHWEESSLGSYKFSETRFLEINEQVCPKSGKASDACHHMLEANEDAIESWWRDHYAKQSNTDLNQFLCVDKLGVCCPNGTYGPRCVECSGGKDRPCGGNGRCSGDGTRQGTGVCSCNVGYKNKLCDVCEEGYYKEDRHVDSVVCKKCHESCKSLCSGPGPSDCVDCAEGYTRSAQDGCVDDDECEDKEICEENQYCTNTAGSFRCLSCSAVCSSCVGPGDKNCTVCARKHFMDVTTCRPCHPSCLSACKDASAGTCDACAFGWTLRGNNECDDIDECSRGSVECAEDEYCVNSVGSYTCSTCHPACHGCEGPGNEGCIHCKEGYALSDNKCLDVDECKSLQSGDSPLPDDTDARTVRHKCTGERVVCVNTPGSFRCDCEAGYIMSAGQCVLKPKNFDEINKKKTPPAKKSTTAKTKKTKSANGRMHWIELSLYVCALVVFIAIANILEKRFYCQSFMTLVFWIYLYWFGLSLEKLALKYK